MELLQPRLAVLARRTAFSSLVAAFLAVLLGPVLNHRQRAAQEDHLKLQAEGC